jgi:hypothetical protein
VITCDLASPLLFLFSGQREDSNFLMFLDADEIVDSDRMIPWLQSGVLDEYDVIEFAAFEYGETPEKQFLKYVHAGLLIRRGFAQRGFLLHTDDRYFYKDGVMFPNDLARIKLLACSDADGEPMVHHYSTARPTQAHLKRKLMLSGHFEDVSPEFEAFKLKNMLASEEANRLVRNRSLEEVEADNSFSLKYNDNNPHYRIVVPFVYFEAK